MIEVQLAMPPTGSRRRRKHTQRFKTVIDSGASRCIFHSDIGKAMGIDFSACEAEGALGIGGEEKLYLHEVRLSFGLGFTRTKAGFMDSLPLPGGGLLGMAGFFEHFTVTFDSPGKFCTIERAPRIFIPTVTPTP